MRTMLTTVLACTLMLALTAVASAKVIWDGSGSPTSAGYTLSGSEAFTFDSPTTGFMYQDSGYGALAYWNQALAGTEMVRANGWIVEARLESIVHTGPTGLAVYFAACDDVGGVRVSVCPTLVEVFGQNGWSSSLSIAAEEYHTIRVAMVPGGTNVDIYVDNLTTPAQSVLPHTDLADTAVEFGDGTSSGAGKASWDYFYVNHAGGTEPIPGDANLDNIVNDADASILAAHWQQSGAEIGWGDGDFDGNNIVNDADASILAAHWQESQEGAAPVPEPASSVLLAGALLALALWRKTRN